MKKELKREVCGEMEVSGLKQKPVRTGICCTTPPPPLPQISIVCFLSG